MIRKALSIVVLFSLLLHCSSRLGFLSYLYQQKYKMAFAVGLINEIPIASCSSDYDFGDSKKLDVKEESGQPAPSLRQASEITLFFSTVFLPISSNKFISVTYLYPVVKDLFKSEAIHSIFHPPSLS
jgi:hypothetical protein